MPFDLIDFITSQTFSQIKLEANLRNINHCFSDFIEATNTCAHLSNQTHVPIACHYPDSNGQACSFIDFNPFSEVLHVCAFTKSNRYDKKGSDFI